MLAGVVVNIFYADNVLGVESQRCLCQMKHLQRHYHGACQHDDSYYVLHRDKNAREYHLGVRAERAAHHLDRLHP